MESNIFLLAGLLVVIVLLGIIGVLSRYRKCKSDEVLVVYGKTGGSKSAKLYHGGAAFVWPIIQGYDFLSMKPMQIDCKLTGAISAQNIRVDVPTTARKIRICNVGGCSAKKQSPALLNPLETFLYENILEHQLYS